MNKEDKPKIPTGVLIVNNATDHEFIDKWNELMEKYNQNTNIVWSKIFILFDCKIYF